VLLLVLLGLSLAACGEVVTEEEENHPVIDKRISGPEPQRITVDHILIGVKSRDFPTGRRTQAAARAFAYDLLRRLRAGADWASLKAANSEDPPPGGPYSLANHGVPAAGPPREWPRDGMVPAFGNVGFTLEVGAIGIADHDPATSKFGYHLIKRVK
jgi:hypothetical protein